MALLLGIETSCDDTGVALMEDGKLRGELLSSQDKLHAVYGGVVPEIASRAHLEILPSLFQRLLRDCGVGMEEIDAICVTRGPGLMGSLLVGLGFAKGLAMGLEIPLIGVNHLHAHVLAAAMEKEVIFPAVALLISGGHTHLYYVKSPTEFKLIGRTLDDAVGEAFDKVAKLLNLPYPGGRYIDQLASKGENRGIFTLPYVDNQNLDFSFSGIKTAVLNYIQVNPGLPFSSMPEKIETMDLEIIRKKGLLDMCASFNHTIARTLVIKLKRALSMYPHARAIIVAGGVAANSIIRSYMEDFCREVSVPLFIPSPPRCTDNAAMIAFAGGFWYKRRLCHDLFIDAIPRGKEIPLDFKEI